MSAASEFPWPRTPGSTGIPRWTGSGFDVDGKAVPYLHYEEDPDAWEGDLLELHEQEAGSDHFIDVASRQAAIEGLRFSPAFKGVILEVGISSGYLLPELRKACPEALVIGSDLQPDVPSRFHAKDPSFPLLQFDLTRCPLPDNCLDAVVTLNVLEHIKDDGKAMAEIARILKPGGILVLELPAGAWLFDVYDAMLNHYRRYTMKPLISMVREAGLQPLWRSHLGFFLYPGFAAVKLLNRLLYHNRPEAAREKVARQIKGSRHQPFFHFLMGLERKLARHIYLPFGIRCVVVARKPGPWLEEGKR